MWDWMVLNGKCRAPTVPINGSHGKSESYHWLWQTGWGDRYGLRLWAKSMQPPCHWHQTSLIHIWPWSTPDLPHKSVHGSKAALLSIRRIHLIHQWPSTCPWFQRALSNWDQMLAILRNKHWWKVSIHTWHRFILFFANVAILITTWPDF